MRLARIITLASLSLAPAAASVLTTDNTFSPPDWSGALSVQVLGFGSPLFSASTIASGGNTGPFRRIGMIRPIDLPTNATMANVKTSYSYDPGSQGPLVGLGYSADFMVQSFNGMTGAWGFALRQNGTVFINTTTFNSAPGWTLTTINNQIAANFFNPVSSANPDFTASGAPIEFGFFLQGVSGGLFNASFNLGMDNLCVWDQNSGSSCSGQSNVPEPCTLAMVGSLLLALAAFRYLR